MQQVSLGDGSHTAKYISVISAVEMETCVFQRAPNLASDPLCWHADCGWLLAPSEQRVQSLCKMIQGSHEEYQYI